MGTGNVHLMDRGENTMEIKAGIDRTCVTPPLGVELAGYGYDLKRTAESVLDNLYATCLVLETDGRHGFIINVDLIGLLPETIKEVRRRLAAKYGVNDKYVLFLSTHTHTGPSTINAIGIGEQDADYIASLPGKLTKLLL